MHPVVCLIELIDHLTIFSPLPGNRIPDFPMALIQAFIATHDVVQREVHKAFIRIIGSIKARPLVTPDQGVIAVGISIGKFQRGFVDDLKKLALEYRPFGSRTNFARANSREFLGIGHREPFIGIMKSYMI